MKTDPRISRFEELSDAEITRRFEHRPEPIDPKRYGDKRALIAAIARSLKSLAIATPQLVETCRWVHDRCAIHANSVYGSRGSFMQDCYDRDHNSPSDKFAMCLSGPAGMGKSTFLRRMTHVLPAPAVISGDPGSTAFSLVSAWSLDIKESRTAKRMLEQLIKKAGGTPSGKDIEELTSQARRLAHQMGVSVLFVDDLQFHTKSAKASTNIVNTVFTLMEIGVPVLTVANYSLLHKLQNRPQEDRQRLLGDVRVIVPDAPHSAAWSATVTGFAALAPEIFVIDPSTDAADLHVRTAGDRRDLAFLMLIAVAKSKALRPVIGMDELDAAYESVTFADNRKDVELMNLQFATGRCARKDLWCPIPLPQSDEAELKKAAQTRGEEQMVANMLQNSMTPRQRKLYQDLKNAGRGRTKAKTDPKVVAIGERASPSAEEFEEGEEILSKMKKR
jgi:hypothetical protein